MERRPDGVTDPGWLARPLVSAERSLRDAELQVEGYLTRLFPVLVGGWQGWSFHAGVRSAVQIDVYEVSDDPIVQMPAVAALWRGGFATVVLHPHGAKKLLTCVCEQHEAR